MKFINEIIDNIDTSVGKIDATVFFLNIFIIIVHGILMVCYIFLRHNFMIGVNILSLIYYISCIKLCVTQRNFYITMSYLEIWIHILLAICCFGWQVCFQNWIFGLVVGAYLPSFNAPSASLSLKRSFIFSFFLLFTYFLFSVLFFISPIKVTVDMPQYMISFLFVFNNVVSFLTIIMFAVTYTTRKERKEIELTRKADFDELTSIYNRRALDELGSVIIDKCKKKNKPFSVAIIDIDFFKKVNDSYGHTSGDLVLKSVADILKTYSSENIIVGRWGGEEFIFIGSDEIKYNDFVKLIKGLRARIARTKFRVESGSSINITISSGCASIYDLKTLDEAVSIADNNLYKAKQSGRNKVIG